MEAALTKIEGVKSAKVSKPNRSGVVVFDPAKTDPEKIVKAFNKDNGGGYTVAVVEDKDGKAKS